MGIEGLHRCPRAALLPVGHEAFGLESCSCAIQQTPIVLAPLPLLWSERMYECTNVYIHECIHPRMSPSPVFSLMLRASSSAQRLLHTIDDYEEAYGAPSLL